MTGTSTSLIFEQKEGVGFGSYSLLLVHLCEYEHFISSTTTLSCFRAPSNTESAFLSHHHSVLTVRPVAVILSRRQMVLVCKGLEGRFERIFHYDGTYHSKIDHICMDRALTMCTRNAHHQCGFRSFTTLPLGTILKSIFL